MPRKLRLPKARQGVALRLADLSIDQILCLKTAWRPPAAWEPSRRQDRWQTWDQYFHDWALVADEARALWPDEAWFADRARQYYDQQGPVATTEAVAYGGLPPPDRA